MKIGTTKELKNHEYRVGLTPDNVMAFTAKGHTVYVETHAGEGAGFSDEEYKNAGAIIVNTPNEVFEQADMIVKVKVALSNLIFSYQKLQAFGLVFN